MADAVVVKRVLVVDDRASSRRLLRRHLEKRGHAVFEAANGLEGVERFRSVHPHAVITDMRMPDGDGIELVREVRRIADVPIYCITAFPDWETSAEAIKDGADEYFCWPRDVERLLEVVDAKFREEKNTVDVTRKRHRVRRDAQRKAELEEWLERTGGNVTRVAEALHVDRKTVYTRCRRFGIQLRGEDAV